MSLTRLVDGWEAVLLASLTSQGVVRGRVRANKLLAYMQLHGVPVPIRFRNIQMGPASFAVDTRAKVAAGAGLLELVTEKGRADIERHDYRLTPAGMAYTTETILPTLHELSYGPIIVEAISNLTHEHLYAKDQQLIESIHRELHLDDAEELGEAFETTMTSLRSWAGGHGTGPLRDSVMLAAAGTVDLAIMAMDASLATLSNDQDSSTGPHAVLYNAERLVWLLDSLGSLHSRQHKSDKMLVRRFDRILNALESICGIYEILPVPSDEEIDAMFEEAAPFIPDAAKS